uniref:Uncharacterized protein n=1 Tax=Arundo donax TaxID=35708 RepID=A0A0A9B784_ARUDO
MRWHLITTDRWGQASVPLGVLKCGPAHYLSQICFLQ